MLFSEQHISNVPFVKGSLFKISVLLTLLILLKLLLYCSFPNTAAAYIQHYFSVFYRPQHLLVVYNAVRLKEGVINPC